MVKNTKGGSKHKKMARKNINAEAVKEKTRLANPKEPCEMYANVTKMYGQGNCEVMCNDGVQRICVIRKKFKGRNKSRNMISVDTKVLVGIRDWEVLREGKRQKCDLLEVYHRDQYDDIKYDPKSNWNVLVSKEEREDTGMDLFEFTDAVYSRAKVDKNKDLDDGLDLGLDADLGMGGGGDDDTDSNDDPNAFVVNGVTVNFEDI
jgi:initiation factor 1A